MKSALIAKFLASASVLAVSAAYAGVTPNLLDSSGKPVRDGSGACVQELVSVEHPDCVPKKVEPPKPAPVAPVEPAKPAPVVAPVAPPPPVAPAAPPAPVKQNITLAAESLFDSGKAVLKPGGKKSIDEAVAKMSNIDISNIIATGHADSMGNKAVNQKLSERRAAAVKEYMVSKGIPAAKITTIGKGDSQPVASNKTADGRAKNRRVDLEFKGVSKK